ncbi:MAG: DUF3604 domain-containing protein [Lentisphaerae bacterium]|nr:DUF3604 domain-containing protein [Lentisphaerota bacterium]
MNITKGFVRLIHHYGAEIPAWQRNLIGQLFGVAVARVGYLTRLRPNERLEWESDPARAFDDSGRVIVVLHMAVGLGPDGYMPSGEFVLSINGEEVLEFRAVKYSTLWKQDDIRFYYEVKHKRTQPETATAGIGYLALPPRFATGEPLRMALYNRKKTYQSLDRAGISDRWVRIDDYPRNLANVVYLDDGVKAVLADPERPAWNGRQLYFGDLHSHSGRLERIYRQGERDFLRDRSVVRRNCGIKDPDEYYRYARHASQLDFYCLSDHQGSRDDGMNEDDWAYRLEMAHKWESPEFATILGSEFVGPNAGHWIVYFRSGNPLIPPAEDQPMPDIIAQLKQRLANEKLTLVPHQVATLCSSPINWDLYDPKLTRMVEIYSHWGSGEHPETDLPCQEVDMHPACFVDTALRRGYRLGFIASTDEHGGAPGDGITFFNPLGAGLACVWAEDLTRENIYDSLWDRWCFGTTGVRMDLRFTVNGAAMGREIDSDSIKRNLIQVEVDAPEKVKEIVLIKDGDEAAVKPGRRRREQWEWEDPAPTAAGRVAIYYPRVVLQDGEQAWGSPVWVKAE